MQRILGYDLEPRVFFYLDDIVITTETFDEYCDLVKIVAERLRKSGLTINIEKSQICAKQISYLGYIIIEDGLKASPEKIEPILNYQVPRKVRKVRMLLGMASWYRRFIPKFRNYSSNFKCYYKENCLE